VFNATRLTLARRRRGMTKADLVEASGVSMRSITGYEAGDHQPTEENLRALADALEFPVEFFDGPDLVEPKAEGVSFRAYTRMTAKQRDAALGAGALALTLAEWIDKRFNLPAADLPDLQGFEPEAAANGLRAKWGIGERSVKNMIHLLEAHGVRVFSLAEQCLELNAFSHWNAGVPFVFLNTMKSAESSRFDCAHELAHLVLHQHGAPQGRVAEHEADRFASAFLMPQSSVLAYAPRFPTIETLVKLKKIWNVSAIALAHRLHALKLLSDWQYRTICIELSECGARKHEIEGSERESSQVLNKVFEALRSDGTSKRDVAKELSFSVDDLDALVFGLVIGAVPGRGEPDRRKVKPQLKLV
jgi:Zn-dependent peptidase ImmA (M78 family)